MDLLFVLAPVYWFPGVAESHLLVIKLVLLGFVVYLTFMPPGYLEKVRFDGVSSFLVFISAMAIDVMMYFIHGRLELKFVLIFLFINFGYLYFHKRGRGVFFKQARRAAMVFSVFPLILIIDYIVNGGAIYNPQVGISAYLTGFHGGRTGWSLVLGIFLSVVLATALKKTSGLTWFVVVVYSYAIFISGSRGGVLAVLALLAIFCVAKYGFIKGSALYIVSAMIAGITVAVYALGASEIESRILQSIFAPDQLHSTSLTGGRLDGFEVALEIFASSPLWGVGVVNLENYGFGYQSIHNVWLKSLAEAGLLGFSAIVAVTLFVLFKLIIVGRSRGWVVLVLAAGYIPTIYEPTAVFGNFWSSLMFWFLIGAAFAEKAAGNTERDAPLAIKI